MVDHFNCPMRQSTIQSYALEEVRLLCFVIRSIQKKSFSIEGSLGILEGSLKIVLTQNQYQMMMALLYGLRSPETSSSSLESLVDAALRGLYMPSNTLLMMENPFINPSALYTILRSTRKQGGFDEAKSLTVYYARIQFGIRLTVMAAIQEEYQKTKSLLPPSGDENNLLYDQFMKYVYTLYYMFTDV